MKRERNSTSDVEECKYKIKEILREYNCTLNSTYDYSNIYLRDEDNDDRTSMED